MQDKWRNMSAAGQGSREKLRTSKPKVTQDAPATPSVNVQTPTLTVKHELQVNHVKDDPAKDLPDGKNGPRY